LIFTARKKITFPRMKNRPTDEARKGKQEGIKEKSSALVGFLDLAYPGFLSPWGVLV